MRFFNDERGQGAAEYLLLFGGVIVIAVVGLWVYRQYLMSANPFNSTADLQKVRSSVS